MTIVIAIVCADSIVVASDSQVSASSLSTSKRMDGQKIHEVRFKDDVLGLVANSGSVTFGQRAIEFAQGACAGQDLIDYRQLAEAAESGAREANKLMMEPYAECAPSPAVLDDIRRQNNYALLTAQYVNGKPEIFVIECPPGIASRQKNYAAIGCGAGVAEFIISWFDFSKMCGHEAAVTAAFIIGEVKKVDCYCGGPTQVQILYPGAKRLLPFGLIGSIVEDKVEQASVRYKGEWAASLAVAIREIVKAMDEERPL